jgi:transposase-like protein
MTPDLTSEAWAQIRHDYEHTDKPVQDICLEHGTTPNTLRDRVRRWGWTPRRLPIPAEGPPPTPRIEPAAPPVPIVPQIDTAAPAHDDAAAPDPAEPAQIVPRLQGAVARVLPAIETILAKLAAGPTQPREMERAARALAALTRTLRELNTLLSQYRTPDYDDDDMPKDIDAFRRELARRIRVFVAARTGRPIDNAQPQETYSGPQP